MPKFSAASFAELVTADVMLQTLFTELLDEGVDFSILDCARSPEQQRENVKRGMSKTMNSKHVVTQPGQKARACDAAPYPQRWDDPKFREDLFYFSGIVKGYALAKGVKLRTGADWSRNNVVSDERFEDLDHFELED